MDHSGYELDVLRHEGFFFRPYDTQNWGAPVRRPSRAEDDAPFVATEEMGRSDLFAYTRSGKPACSSGDGGDASVVSTSLLGDGSLGTDEVSTDRFSIDFKTALHSNPVTK